MPIYVRCAACGNRIPAGERCTCQAKRNREYDSRYRDSRSKKFYDSEEWRRAKRRALDLDGMDVYMFMTTGRIMAADTVHHIVPLRDDWAKRCTASNLMSLHHTTHSRIEQEYRKNKNSMIRKLTVMLQKFRELTDRGGV